MAKKPTLGGRVLTDDELRQIRQQIEEFDSIEAIDNDLHALIESEWPDLAHKLPPKGTM
jgi:hypothetical protein